MGKVFRIGSIYGTVYLNTAREAMRCKIGGEEPESVEKLDAAEECTRLEKEVVDAKRSINTLRMLLQDLVDASPSIVLGHTDAGRRAKKFIDDNPLPPATSADRDGQRSHGS